MTVEMKLRAFHDRLARFPSGYLRGRYQGRSYGISLTRPLPGIEKLYAEELGGSDIISFNYYTTNQSGPLLKPCEMSSERVVDFVLGVELIAA